MSEVRTDIATPQLVKVMLGKAQLRLMGMTPPTEEQVASSLEMRHRAQTITECKAEVRRLEDLLRAMASNQQAHP